MRHPHQENSAALFLFFVRAPACDIPSRAAPGYPSSMPQPGPLYSPASAAPCGVPACPANTIHLAGTARTAPPCSAHKRCGSSATQCCGKSHVQSLFVCSSVCYATLPRHRGGFSHAANVDAIGALRAPTHFAKAKVRPAVVRVRTCTYTSYYTKNGICGKNGINFANCPGICPPSCAMRPRLHLCPCKQPHRASGSPPDTAA